MFVGSIGKSVPPTYASVGVNTQPIANTSIFKPEEGKRAPLLYRQIEQPPSCSAPTGSLLPLLSDTVGPASILSPVLHGSLLASSDPAGDSNTDLQGLLLSACEAGILGWRPLRKTIWKGSGKIIGSRKGKP